MRELRPQREPESAIVSVHAACPNQGSSQWQASTSNTWVMIFLECTKLFIPRIFYWARRQSCASLFQWQKVNTGNCGFWECKICTNNIISHSATQENQLPGGKRICELKDDDFTWFPLRKAGSSDFLDGKHKWKLNDEITWTWGEEQQTLGPDVLPS